MHAFTRGSLVVPAAGRAASALETRDDGGERGRRAERAAEFRVERRLLRSVVEAGEAVVQVLEPQHALRRPRPQPRAELCLGRAAARARLEDDRPLVLGASVLVVQGDVERRRRRPRAQRPRLAVVRPMLGEGGVVVEIREADGAAAAAWRAPKRRQHERTLEKTREEQRGAQGAPLAAQPAVGLGIGGIRKV